MKVSYEKVMCRWTVKRMDCFVVVFDKCPWKNDLTQRFVNKESQYREFYSILSARSPHRTPRGGNSSISTTQFSVQGLRPAPKMWVVLILLPIFAIFAIFHFFHQFRICLNLFLTCESMTGFKSLKPKFKVTFQTPCVHFLFVFSFSWIVLPSS